MNSNKSLDLSSGDILPGGKVQQWDSGDTNWNQLWSIKGSAAEGWRIFAASNGLGLGFVNGLLTTVSAARATSWKLTPYVLSMSEGYYTVASSIDGNQVLEIANGSWDEGAHVSSYQGNGTLAQKWYIRKTTNGTYTLQNVNSGLYASVSGNSVTQKNRDASSEWKLDFSHERGLTLASAKTAVCSLWPRRLRTVLKPRFPRRRRESLQVGSSRLRASICLVSGRLLQRSIRISALM